MVYRRNDNIRKNSHTILTILKTHSVWFKNFDIFASWAM